jgi:hypothetical protein
MHSTNNGWNQGLRTTNFREEVEPLNGVKAAPTVWRVSSQRLHMISNRASPSPPRKVELKDPTWQLAGVGEKCA